MDAPPRSGSGICGPAGAVTPAHGRPRGLTDSRRTPNMPDASLNRGHVMAFIFYLTHIHLGYDALASLDSECARIGIKRPLIITDKGVLAAGLVSQTVQALNLDAGAVP